MSASDETTQGLGIGPTLREAREEAGLAIEDVARSTKIRSDYLRALEAEEFNRMGGDVYAKGFLKTYAKAVGLDPEALLAIYRRQVQGSSQALSGSLAKAPVAREPRGAPPMWLAWSVVGVIVMIAIVALANLIGGTSPEPAQPPRVPTAVSPSDTESVQPTPTPTPTPTFDGVNIVLTFDQESWVRVTTDGTVVHEAVQKRGSTLSYKATDVILVRFGNAGGVRVQLNGRDLGVVGEAGRVEERTYTENGAA